MGTPEQTACGRRILLVLSGGIAACKAPDLIRSLRERGFSVRCVMTQAAAQFVTPLTVSALSGDTVYQDLFSLTDEAQMGHIRLSRDADLVLVAPCTASLMARMATGLADDLASTVLLATDKPVMIAPAMNTRMWEHPATQANRSTLLERGIRIIEPGVGELACGEYGVGRMAEVPGIVAAVEAHFRLHESRSVLAGLRALVTSGPTIEAIDPVRFISNHSSGRQGHAVAAALAALGADVTLVHGPVSLPVPSGVSAVPVQSAREMLQACLSVIEEGRVDVAVCVAAVADWYAHYTSSKIKKGQDPAPLSLTLHPNPDILATLSRPGPHRPRLVIGFAAETGGLVEQARAKRQRKGCDWICANDVSPGTGTFGGMRNTVYLVTETTEESWPAMDKTEVAARLARSVASALGCAPSVSSSAEKVS
ncbi:MULTISPECIES: bifunctional phosphopantothenoylcysteine decarboxylase/phosphopantothenate--cysteine ligase CoaBC [unclassified Haematospirillum]|uniref:bifunctional phosphopantothenoylcysteine decarboxylase/phosphopantothenate--cysteine ligase CoaBC n=1 Tax=unclassified Haematospirillum TaxID=2622088 RepID=UPI001438FE5D|nr:MULTISPECIES: bifunctional phosphopantothenoylcysteine decarboxylase/phosphopantothenate--cysteine ligase CoaBC [unclassified Haematospirillum]NKD55406.1 bifunctional phosphopantothenoylcysteine decarboxylase/phosphopantothenate--cysteine ligase CoaBC [Haematospirillum sp. H4890]NKD75466.1 bifunctional phosphopantothenoylcysteine decarboxylase/phosphopantothenate--cysteine ligase CoaBC [Haematospirillum sp. H4485]NKD87809.1 bifunctional phosphopantothenoylcysteine decarboxylase/phosphopantoth